MARNADADLLKFTFKVAGRSYDEDLGAQAAFELDPAGLNAALARNPGMYAYWATLEVFAKSEVDELEEKLEQLEAELATKFEADGVGGKDNKVTLIRTAVKASPERAKLVAKVREARVTLGLIRVGTGTIDRRLNAVFEAARNMRAEMEIAGKGTRVKDRYSAATNAMDREFPIF